MKRKSAKRLSLPPRHCRGCALCFQHPGPKEGGAPHPVPALYGCFGGGVPSKLKSTTSCSMAINLTARPFLLLHTKCYLVPRETLSTHSVTPTGEVSSPSQHQYETGMFAFLFIYFLFLTTRARNDAIQKSRKASAYPKKCCSDHANLH